MRDTDLGGEREISGERKKSSKRERDLEISQKRDLERERKILRERSQERWWPSFFARALIAGISTLQLNLACMIHLPRLINLNQHLTCLALDT